MDTKKRGRKAEAGTYEAREYVRAGNLDEVLKDQALVAGELSEEAKARIIKAVKFGLGIKE